MKCTMFTHQLYLVYCEASQKLIAFYTKEWLNVLSFWRPTVLKFLKS